MTLVPSAPSVDLLVKSNATFASINLATWADHGCSIMNFALQYKLHLSNDYIMLSNNIIPEQKSIFLSDLLPASWYDVIMTAFSEAGSTEAQYQFATLTVDGGKWIHLCLCVSVCRNTSPSPLSSLLSTLS